jgi:regulator of replication initiation timing
MIIRNANKILQENDRLRQENAKLKDDLERVRRDYRTLKTASMSIPAVTNNIRDASDEAHIQITW